MSKPSMIPAKPVRSVPSADAWVASGQESTILRSAPAETSVAVEAPAEPTKRLTFDIPESLHRAIKVSTASRGVVMAEEIRELLKEKYLA